MTYEYEPSKAEIKAAQLLREKGWIVNTPTCPECKGNGYISEFEPVAESKVAVVGGVKYVPCPNGCIVTMWIDYASLPVC